MFRARPSASRGRRGFRSVAGASAPPLPALSPGLAKWRDAGLSGKRVVIVSDSTSAPGSPPMGNTPARMNANYCQPGQTLYGASFNVNGSNSGASMEQFMADAIGTGITWLLTQDFDVVICGFGINNIRTGATTQAALTTMLTNFVNQVRASKPNAEIILWGPGSFLTTDVGGNGYVTPNASAQTYTDRLYNAYADVLTANPSFAAYTTVLQRQDVVGRTCQASSPMMLDQIHNTEAGYSAITAALATALRPYGWPYQAGVDPLWPWTVFGHNGALVDITGRHTLTVQAGGVALAGNKWVCSGAGGVLLTGNLTDFDFGNSATMQRTTRVTIEVRANPTNVTRNGHTFWSNNSQLMRLGSNPAFPLEVTPGAASAGGGPYATGAEWDFVWTFSDDQVSVYAGPAGTVLNKINSSPDFKSANFNTNSGTPMGVAQPGDGWNQATLIGTMSGMRVTRANRTNHAATYGPLPFPFPTS